MDAGNMNCRIFVFKRVFNFSLIAKGEVVLGNLVGFGEVWVEVVFAVKFGNVVNFAIKSQAQFDTGFDGRLVRYRKGTGETETNRTGMGVRLDLKVSSVAAAEHFGFGFWLDVDFETDDGEEFRIRNHELEIMVSEKVKVKSAKLQLKSKKFNFGVV